MAGCDRLELKLGALLDGELGPRQEEEIRDHLAGCPVCRSRLRALQSLEREAVAALQPPDPTEEEWGRIRAGIRRAAAGARKPVAFPRARRSPSVEALVPALALAACLAIVTVIKILSSAQPEPPKAPDVYTAKEYEIRVEPLAPEDEDGALWIEVTRG